MTGAMTFTYRRLGMKSDEEQGTLDTNIVDLGFWVHKIRNMECHQLLMLSDRDNDR